MTPYQQHVAKWKNCQRCPLAERRRNVCHVRGQLPADILFVGEAPGPSENMLGKPFVGPAGHLLDQIISESIPPSMRISFTNLVGCIPLNEDNDKFAEPPDEAIKKCSTKLREIIDLAKPKLIVCVGKLSSRWAKKLSPRFVSVKFVDIMHPAFILRSSAENRSLLVQRCRVLLRDAAERL